MPVPDLGRLRNLKASQVCLSFTGAGGVGGGVGGGGGAGRNMRPWSGTEGPLWGPTPPLSVQDRSEVENACIKLPQLPLLQPTQTPPLASADRGHNP